MDVDVDGDLVDVPREASFDCRTPRKFVNATDEVQRWLMFGASPVGAVDDLGEFVMAEE